MSGLHAGGRGDGVERGTRGRALVTGDPAAAQQCLGIVVDRPARRDDDSVGVAQQVFGDHAARRRGIRPPLEDDQVQLAGAQLREPVRFADLGHRRDDRGLGDRRDRPRPGRRAGAAPSRTRRYARARCARHVAPWRPARPPRGPRRRARPARASACPAAVSARLRPPPRRERSTRLRPVSASSRVRCWDTADGLRYSARAAGRTPPARCTARRTSRRWGSSLIQ